MEGRSRQFGRPRLEPQAHQLALRRTAGFEELSEVPIAAFPLDSVLLEERNAWSWFPICRGDWYAHPGRGHPLVVWAVNKSRVRL